MGSLPQVGRGLNTELQTHIRNETQLNALTPPQGGWLSIIASLRTEV